MKAAIFDLDGTLIESLSGIAASLNETRKTRGLSEYPESVVRSFIGDGQWVLLRRAYEDTFSDGDISEIEKEFSTYYKDYWRSRTIVFDGIREMLQKLSGKGVKLGVLSNKKHPFTVEITEELFGRELLPLIYGQRDGIPKKPEAAALLSVCEEIGLAREEVVYIGDSTVDLEVAKNAGTQCVGVTWGYHDPERLTPYGYQLCATVKELEQTLLDKTKG